MFRKIWKAFFMLTNRDRIPKLPRGMLATAYTADEMTPEIRRVLARIGARDPQGVKVAMKRAGAETLEELVQSLEHYRPERHAVNRFRLGLGRLIGGYDHDPHEEDIKRLMNRREKSSQQKEIEQRVIRTRKAFKETSK